jgi:hypothetical protein
MGCGITVMPGYYNANAKLVFDLDQGIEGQCVFYTSLRIG